MRQQRLFASSRGILVVCAALALTGGTAWAVSGIRVFENPVQATSGNPPCNAERITTFRMKIANSLPVLGCAEDVNPVRLSIPAVAGVPGGEVFFSQEPPGSFEFLGFKRSLDGTLEPTLQFAEEGQVDADEVIEFFFDVRTAPVAVPGLGQGDFVAAEFGITVCDSGGPCDILFWADPPDPLCESPTPLAAPIRLGADPSFCPASSTGTAALHGTVSDAQGRPVVGARVQATRGCRGSAGFVDQSVTTPPACGRAGQIYDPQSAVPHDVYRAGSG